MTGPLLLADAPALLYRAFFALPDSIRGADDRPVNALLGSVNALLFCVERYRPRAVVVCFGAEAGAYRVEAFPAYHADRPQMPDDLAHQWDRAAAFYEALGWSVADTDDLEADDLLGAFAHAEADAGGTCLILTGDRDMFQCATDAVTVLLQQRGGDGPAEVGPAEVQIKYGVRPDQVPDFIALRGDPSDSLPGAKGIGAKTAADILQRHGTLAAAIEGAVREKPSVRKALLGQTRELLMFKDIATLRPVAVVRPQDASTDGARGGAMAAELGMQRLADRLRAATFGGAS